MENASKALLIAGAISLVIAIIAIAVGIVSSTRGTIDVAGNQIDGMSVQMHNKQFEEYAGIGKSIDEAKELIRLVASNNSSTQDSKRKIEVELWNQFATHDQNKFEGQYWDKLRSETEVTTIYNWRFFTEGSETTGGNIGRTYNIKLTYDSSGYITKIDFYRRYK